MILPAILYTFKGKLLLGFYVIFTTIAVTEAFLGQLIIAVTVAVIGAIPTTAAVIIMARKQSAERLAGNKELLQGQKEVAKAVDGQLAKFVEAKQQLGHREGVEQERKEQRGREGEAAIAQQASPNPAAPTPVIIKNLEDDPANVKLAPKKIETELP